MYLNVILSAGLGCTVQSSNYDRSSLPFSPPTHINPCPFLLCPPLSSIRHRFDSQVDSSNFSQTHLNCWCAILRMSLFFWLIWLSSLLLRPRGLRLDYSPYVYIMPIAPSIRTRAMELSVSESCDILIGVFAYI